MSYRLLILLALVAGLMLWCRGPSVKTIVSHTKIDPDAGTLAYKGNVYSAEWGEPIVHQGDLRRIERARYKFAPFFTHHAVVTTGDFSDSDLVTVSPFNGGSIVWSARQQPSGTLVVLHFVPRDATALAELARLDDGDCARIAGREEIDGAIQGPGGAYARLNSDNHRYVLVEKIRPCA